MKKEQIAFVVILLLLGFLGYTTLAGSDGQGAIAKRSRRGRTAQSRDVASLKPAEQALFSLNESSWSGVGRNVFRAPSDYASLPPVPLPPPPRSMMPPARPVPSPGFDPFRRVKLVAEFTPAEGVDLAPRSASGLDAVFGEEVETGQEGDDAIGLGDPEAIVGVEVPEKPEPRLSRSEKKIKSLADRLKKNALDLIEQEREEIEQTGEDLEKKQELDKLHWASEVWIGRILNDAEKRAGQEGYDKYELKLRLDAIRADADLSAAERDAALADRELEVEFQRWRDGKFDRVQKYGAQNLQLIEFGDTARNRFELGIRAADAKDVAAQLDLVKGLVAAGGYDRAKNHLLEMGDEARKVRAYHVALADVAARDFDYDTQMRAISAGLEAFPADADLLAMRGSVESRLGLADRARASLEKALEVEPRNVRALAALGRHLLDQGPTTRDTPERAAALLKKALAGDFNVEDDRRRTLVDLGRARLALGQVAEAKTSFSDVLVDDPENEDAKMGLAATAFLSGDTELARATAEEVLAVNPLAGRAYYLLGLCDLEEEKWENARDHIYDAFEADPFLTARAQVALGYLFERLGRRTDAQAAYASALEADPQDPEVILAHGRGLLLAGDFEQARDYLERALNMMPGQFEVMALLSETNFQLERFEDALRFTDAAIEFAPQSNELLLRKAHVLMRLSRFDEAKAILDQAKQQEDSVEAELAYAYYYYARKNADESLKRFRAALKRFERENKSPLANYARRYEYEIAENLAMQVWSDGFNRAGTGRDLLRGWESYAPASGVQITLDDGRVRFTGKQRESDVASSIFQRRTAKELVSFEATLAVDSGAGFTAAIALLTFRKKTGNQNALVEKASGGLAYSGIIVGKTPEGRLAWRSVERYELSPWQEVGDGRWPAAVEGTPTPLAIGIAVDQQNRGRYDILVNGRAAATGIEIKGLGRANREVQLWVFTQAEIERRIEMGVDDVRIVTRQEGR
jgi:tetratricopeptide (TPR) repeat protein